VTYLGVGAGRLSCPTKAVVCPVREEVVQSGDAGHGEADVIALEAAAT